MMRAQKRIMAKLDAMANSHIQSPFNACCYREHCKALEARALAAEAALAAERERADMAVRQMIKQNDRLAAIRAQGE